MGFLLACMGKFFCNFFLRETKEVGGAKKNVVEGCEKQANISKPWKPESIGDWQLELGLAGRNNYGDEQICGRGKRNGSRKSRAENCCLDKPGDLVGPSRKLKLPFL
jgi:hypothetical protein